ncbi:hypothetical protein GcM1_226078 [Golovinomyces cichoracearum]|uniref:Uncharacterized protein n=1 Tax=Golovinomyces cichoracearum TaxID=62708 RepID=A0A420IQ27_9PEZI|nr:hypothetical protein GcM1_226078 [Golovinomyces cichoracearum]
MEDEREREKLTEGQISLLQTESKFIDIDFVGEPLLSTDATAVELNIKIFDFMMNNQNIVDTELFFLLPGRIYGVEKVRI